MEKEFKWGDETQYANSSMEGAIRLGNVFPDQGKATSFFSRIRAFFLAGRRIDFEQESIGFEGSFLINDFYFNPSTGRYYQIVRIESAMTAICISWICIPSRWENFKTWLRGKHLWLEEKDDE